MFVLFIQSLGILALIAAAIVGAAIGLYKTVIYIEDHTIAFKETIFQIIMAVSFLHVVMLFRGVGILQVLFSAIIQFIFYNLYLKYPDFSLTDPFLITGSVMALINHFLVLRLLIFQFWIPEVIFYFFFCVWFTPFCFYVSLSANEDIMTDLHRKKRVRTVLGDLIGRVVNNVKKNF
ncbi:hypothetical protein M153_6262000310 [Pseudoloma neurophilia]|uniref:Protein TEX261 n=1 Tax=Pseudoloma neurophilia TaxID=146866 RepID=A0A0R0LSE5_9MICR|nr:hypothetical protein M153_6262000310 [Pseudoloma neurophilia]